MAFDALVGIIERDVQGAGRERRPSIDRGQNVVDRHRVGPADNQGHLIGEGPWVYPQAWVEIRALIGRGHPVIGQHGEGSVTVGEVLEKRSQTVVGQLDSPMTATR